MRIGYVGLGAMGGPLARRLLMQQPIRVLDLDAATVEAMRKLGAATASSALELARSSDVVILCLPRSSDVAHVIFGPGGLSEGLSPGALVIDFTSGIPEETLGFSQRLAERGIALIDAALSGGVPAAEAGTVMFMAAGPTATYERALPVLRAMSPNVFRCGERVGDGQAMKLVNNAINATTRLATLEAVLMGSKRGLPLAQMTAAVNAGPGQGRVSRSMLPSILANKPASNFALSLMVKDVNLAIAIGARSGVPMTLTSLVRALLQIGVNQLGPAAKLDDVLQLTRSLASADLADQSCRPRPSESEQAALCAMIETSIVACNLLATCECLVMGHKFGLSLAGMARVLVNGSGSNAVLERVLPALAAGAKSVAGRQVQQVVAELTRATETGFAVGAPMPITNVARTMFEAGANELGGSADMDQMVAVFERAAAIKVAGH